jgi:hypothetical protein
VLVFNPKAACPARAEGREAGRRKSQPWAEPDWERAKNSPLFWRPHPPKVETSRARHFAKRSARRTWDAPRQERFSPGQACRCFLKTQISA